MKTQNSILNNLIFNISQINPPKHQPPVRDNIKKVSERIRESAREKGNWDAAVSILAIHWTKDRERLEGIIEHLKEELLEREQIINSVGLNA